MGNSNSIGQFTPNEIDLRQRAHWQYLSQQHHHGSSSSHQNNNNPPNRASFQPNDTSNTSIKVLPELNDTSGHLRSTDNGVILFNGGTISGRRDSSGVGVVRSKSISAPQQEYMRGLQRHKTQLEMPVTGGRGGGGGGVSQQHHMGMGIGLRRDVDPKLFGSEPDLRLSPADGGSGGGRNSRKFKGQPKLLTTNQQQEQQQREYDSTRFGWRPKSQQQQQQPPPQGQHHHQRQQQNNQQQQQSHSQQQQRQDRMPMEPPKKPRLFKTREETKKVSSKANQSKLATEASDVQSKKPMPGRQMIGKRDTERIRDDSTTDRVIKVIGNRAPVPEKLLPKAEVLSKPVFRREKSFDISMLLSRGAQKAQTSLFPNVFRKSSTADKNAPLQHDKAIPTTPAQAHHNLSEDKSVKSRRSSQPPPRLTDRDFQKELQEATRRRSMLVPLKEDNSANKSPVVQKSAIVTQSPVLKALAKPRPAGGGGGAKENARPHQKSKAPKPPQSPKVDANKIQLEIRNGPSATNPVIESQQHPSLSSNGTTSTDEQAAAAAASPAIVAADEGDEVSGGAAAEKPVKSFYYGMPGQERTGNVAAKVNGFQHENGNGQLDDVIGSPTASEEERELEQKVELTAIESFAESIFAMKNKQQQLAPQRDSSESAVSSFADDPLSSSQLLYPSTNNNNNGLDNSRSFDDTESLEGISLQLRPTLPKKQFEIPRFSPAAAWRLLTTANTETAREVTSQFKERLMEQMDGEDENDSGSLVSGEANDRNQETESRGGEAQIERIYREPVPGLADNKSGDSGISGDGGLELGGGGDSSPTNNNLLVNDLRKLGPFLQPWTPQQDLEDDSSSDPDPLEHNNLNDSAGACNRLKDLRTIEDVAQKHVFSLSLPRDSGSSGVGGANLSDKGGAAAAGCGGAASLVGSDKHFFSSLQKTKMGHCYADSMMMSATSSGRSQQATTTTTQAVAAAGNDNWFLGRSQPNSIEKNPMPSLSDNEDVVSLPKITDGQQPAIQPPSFNYLAGGCHFMYLPNRPTSMSLSSSTLHHNGVGASLLTSASGASTLKSNVRSSAEKVNNGPPEASLLLAPPPPPPLPHSSAPHSRRMRESLQDEESEDQQQPVWNVPLRVGGRKGRRFTFQSTVRQIERRKIADKLSREAEEREVQRLSELEAMQKVEQEFQMKRAREKASIRQQLRLFSLEANQREHQQQFQCDADYSPSAIRREPDGAAETLGKMNGCHTLSSTSLLLELNGYQQQQPQQAEQQQPAYQSMMAMATSATNILTRDYSKFPYREFLK